MVDNSHRNGEEGERGTRRTGWAHLLVVQAGFLCGEGYSWGDLSPGAGKSQGES